MLTYQKYVMYRGKETHLSKLKPCSTKKVTITCQWCGVVFDRYFFRLRQSGSFLCQKCAIADKLSKTVEMGLKNNKLTILGPSERSGFSICRCDCGGITEVPNHDFISGRVQSCGCLRVENMKTISMHPKNKNHWNWKNGVTGEREKLMSQKIYKDWRSSVYKRDDFTCLKCKVKGGSLRAHHIENYADNKDQALGINNGATLCAKCHREFHKKYGNKNTNKNQLNEFLSNKKYLKRNNFEETINANRNTNSTPRHSWSKQS